MNLDDIQLTPEHELKPKLEFVGRLLGHEMYADVHSERDRKLVEEVLASLIKRSDQPKETT